MPYFPPSTLPGVAPSGSGGFVAAPMATTVPQTQAATQFTATRKMSYVLSTDRAAQPNTAGARLGKDSLGSSALSTSTLGTSSGGGGGGSAGSTPAGEGETDVPTIDPGCPTCGGEEETAVDENGNDVSTALGTSIGAALRGAVVPLAIGVGVGALLGFVLSR